MPDHNSRKEISLEAELAILEGAVEAIHTLRAWAEGQPPQTAFRADPQTSVLVLLMQRLSVLRAALRGAVDPAVLWSAQNAVIDPRDPNDASLAGWTPAKALHQARAEVARLERSLADGNQPDGA